MTTTPPAEPCGRCRQTRPTFQPEPAWGEVPAPLCTRCWQTYADARARRTFVDFADAFDNADDDRLNAFLGGAAWPAATGRRCPP